MGCLGGSDLIMNKKCLKCGKNVKTSKAKFCRHCYLINKKENANPSRCIDCGCVLKNRGKKTRRCRKCNVIFIHKNATGRKLPFCKKCGIKMSIKKTKTGLCFKCYMKNHIPWNKGIKGLIPWNKGISIFSSREEYVIHRNKKRKERRKKQNVQEKLADRMRTLIRNHIIRGSGARKGYKSEILLGCSFKFFREYIANLFCEGMSWDNYGNGKGKWNIDHIIPVSSFNLFCDIEQKKAFHFTNCRPMWAIDNIKKGNKI